jgi:hypothetical protein
MKMSLDPNFFTQIGLDSGSLTLLATVAHSCGEAGEYRGAVRRGGDPEATFYVSADKNSSVAQANIDLATLAQPGPGDSKCGCSSAKNRFVVHPKGYLVFHVSGGQGGYSVHLRKADENPDTKIFESSELQIGDVFSAVILRPGTYSMTNLLTKASGEITVSYPVVGKTPYRPPSPVFVECIDRAFRESRIKLRPGQGVNFKIQAPSRIKVELVKPDDGPKRRSSRDKV